MSAEKVAAVVALDAVRSARGVAPSPDLPAGDPLSGVYRREREALHAFLLRRTGDPSAADELIQEVWLRVADPASRPSLDKPEAYLQRVAANLAIDHLRRRKFQTGFLATGIDVADVADPAPDPHQQLAARQKLDALRTLIDQLPPKRREAFLLYRGQGLSLKAAAAALGVAPQTVRLQAARALVDLRQALAEAGLWP